MLDIFLKLDSLNQVFTICAILGGIIFVIKTLLMFMGADADIDFDADFDCDLDAGDATDGFMWLSIHAITAFFMMFGLGGLTANIQFKWHPVLSILFAFTVGLITICSLNFVKKKLYALESDGSLKMASAIGTEGEVYLTIHKKRSGKVSLTIQGANLVVEAISADNVELQTGTIVEVVAVVKGNILSVKQK